MKKLIDYCTMLQKLLTKISTMLILLCLLSFYLYQSLIFFCSLRKEEMTKKKRRKKSKHKCILNKDSNQPSKFKRAMFSLLFKPTHSRYSQLLEGLYRLSKIKIHRLKALLNNMMGYKDHRLDHKQCEKEQTNIDIRIIAKHLFYFHELFLKFHIFEIND